MPVVKTGLNNVIPSTITTTAGTATFSNTTGLVSCTNVSNLSLNSVFSSAYDNYIINIHGYFSTDQYPTIRLRTVSDNTADYWWYNTIHYGGTYTNQQVGTTAGDSGRLGYSSIYATIGQIIVGSPFLSQRTVMYVDFTGNYSNPTIHTGVILHNNVSSFTGYTIGMSGFYGSISTYGFTK